MTQFIEDREDCYSTETEPYNIAIASSILGSIDHDTQRVPTDYSPPFEQILLNDSNPVLPHQNSDVFDTLCHRPPFLKDSSFYDWRTKRLNDWLPHDTCFWVYAVADMMGYNYQEALPYMSKFSQTTGTVLASMTLDDFSCMVANPEFSSRLYTTLQDHINRTQYSQSSDDQYEFLATLQTMDTNQMRQLYNNSSNTIFNIPSSHYDLEPPSTEIYENQDVSNLHYDSGIENSSSYDESCSDSDQETEYYKSEEGKYDIKMEEGLSDKEKQGPTKRGPGRPPGTKKVKPEKIGKVWEFIRDLLLDPAHNPSVICWVDQENGIFRFVQSDKAAKLWGIKKNNPKMTFDKLTRAMRYYYKHGILRSSTKRLVYGFGPLATGWKIDTAATNHPESNFSMM